MFHKVQCLLMNDTYSFNRKVFQIVSKDFTSLRTLWIYNDRPQKDKQYSSTLTTFPHLTVLDLHQAQLDYAEQLLLKKNAYLPRSVNLHISD